MPTANPFQAKGRRNGFGGCLVHATDSAINAIDGQTIATGSGYYGQGKFRLRQLSIDDLSGFIWNLYSVAFPDITISTTYANGDPVDINYEFSSPAIYKIGGFDSVLPNLESLEPRERCDFAPEITLSPLSKQDGSVGSADIESEQNAPGPGDPPSYISGDGHARFDIMGACYATDTGSYYLLYMSGLYGDDSVSFIQEIPFANLTFNYYTYS